MQAWEQVNPSMLPGVHLCEACEHSILSEEAGKLKKLKSTPHIGGVDKIPVGDQDPTQPVFTQDGSGFDPPLWPLDQPDLL